MIDAKLVEADVAAIDAALKDVTPYATKRIAHFDRKWKKITLQYGPVYSALDLFRDLARKCALLFKGQHASLQLGRLTQFDVRKILKTDAS